MAVYAATNRTLLLAIGFSLAAATGCLGLDDGTRSPAEASRAITADNKLSMNKLSMNKLSMNKLSLNGITLDPVALAGLDETAEGQEVLEFLVRCALPAGDELVLEDADGAVVRAFPGSLGVAPEWRDGPLSASGKRWVTACLLAHVNAFSASVQISLRGPHPALAASAAERHEYAVQEAAFYGDLFDGDGEAYACTGSAPPAGRASSDDLALRVCARDSDGDGTTDCGMVASGACGASGHEPRACEDRHGSDGAFARCHPASLPPRALRADGARHDEVVTTYLRQSDDGHR